MSRWITWMSSAALLTMLVVMQTGCGTTTGVVMEDRSLDDGTYASPESALDTRRPTFPPHTEGP